MRRVLAFLALLPVFVAALLLGVWLHVDLPRAQRALLEQVNTMLAGSFQGEVELQGVDRLRPGGVSDARLVVRDPRGKQVLRLEGVDADYDLTGLISSVVGRKGPVRIRIPELSIDDASVLIETGPSGELTLVEAFEPAQPAKQGRPTEVSIGEIRIDHVWVHGGVPALPTIDADVDDVRGSLASGEDGLELELDHARIAARSMPRGLDPRGTLEGTFETEPLLARAEFRGHVGPLPVEASGAIDGEQIRARVSVAETSAERVRQVFPEAPIHEPVAIEASVHGTLPSLSAELSARIGRGSFDLDGRARLGAEPKIEARFSATELAPRAFAPAAPEGRVSFRGSGRVTIEREGRVRGEVDVRTSRTVLDGVSVPPLDARAKLTERTLDAHVDVHEPGAPIDVDVSYRPGRVELDAELVVPELRRVTRLPLKAKGSLRARVRGQVSLPEKQVTARIYAQGSNLEQGPVSAVTVRVSGSVRGPLEALEGELGLRAESVRAFGRRVERIAIDAGGPMLEPALRVSASGPDVPTLRGRAELDLKQHVVVRNVALALVRGDVRALATADRIVLRNGVSFDDVTFEGPGALRASGHVSARRVSLSARAEELELGQISRLFGIPGLRAGTASFVAEDLRSDASGLHGSFRGSVVELSVGPIENGRASARLAFSGKRVSGALQAALGDAVTASVVAEELELPPDGFSLASLRHLQGGVRLTASADLARVVELVPEARRPKRELRGDVFVEGFLERDRGIESELSVRTRGLDLGGMWAMDVALDAKLERDGTADVAASVRDSHGPLVRARAQGELSGEALLQNPRAALRRALDSPLTATVVVPERKLAELPLPLRPVGLSGSIGLEAKLSGTLDDPKLTVELEGSGLRRESADKEASFGLHADLEFEDERGSLLASVEHRERRLLDVTSRFKLKPKALVTGGDPQFLGSLALRARGFSLESIPALDYRQIRGRVSGAVEIAGLGYAPRASGKIMLSDARIAKTPIRSAVLDIAMDGERLKAELALRHDDGYLDAEVEAGIDWRRRLIPVLDESGRLVVRARADDLRAGVFLPLLDRTVSKLDGKIDANVKLVHSGAHQAAAGSIVLRDGLVQIPTIGHELRHVRGRVDFEPNGVVRIRDVSARGLTGRVRAAAAVRLDGLRPVALNGNVRIAEREKLPLTIEGVSVGDAWGSVDIEARAQTPTRTVVSLDVRRFHLELPDLPRQELQSLEDPERIRIGASKNGHFTELPLQPIEEDPGGEPSELVVRVDLGDRVWIRQGTMLRVKLDGSLTVRIRTDPSITGRIQLSRGRIDVQGKLFELVEGSVTFRGEQPPNPLVVARARWESPDGIVVYADFSGPIDSGKLTLHSQPAMTDDQILALLLFGTPDGTFGVGRSGDGGQAATAVGVGGGVATKGLNAALGRLTHLDVTTRIDTSGTQPRPELAVQVTRRLSASLGYNVGEPAPGKAPDRTLLSLDFRLGRRWSLSSTFGDRGSSLLELIWRYRY